MSYSQELTKAISAVKKASNLCKNIQNKLKSDESVSKDDRSPVTIADFGSQALIIDEILKSFPNDPVVAEEDALFLRENKQLRDKVHEHVIKYNPDMSEQKMLDIIDYGVKEPDYKKRYWTLDPIDGTKGFLRGDQYAIALALVENGQLVLGVLGCPNMEYNAEYGNGCIFYAVKDQGSKMRHLEEDVEQEIKVDTISDPALACFCESVESGHSSHDVHEKISKELGITKPPFRIDSQCKYAAIARGDVPIYLRMARGSQYKEKIWDHAAGVIVVQEAGGKVTDFKNQPLDFTTGRKLDNAPGILVTNNALHENVLTAIKKTIDTI